MGRIDLVDHLLSTTSLAEESYSVYPNDAASHAIKDTVLPKSRQ